MQQPMYNHEAEQSVLGGILIDESAAAGIFVTLQPVDFGSNVHRNIYRAMRSLRGAGMPIDLTTLQEQMTKDDTLAESGGLAYVIELARLVPSAANVKHYAAIVAEWSDKRKQLAMLNEMAETIQNNDKPRLEELRKEIGKFVGTGKKRPVFDLSSAIDRSIRMMTEAAPELDSVFYEALPMGEPGILTAKGGVGKSFFTVQMAVAVATGRKVFSGSNPFLQPKKKGKVLILGGEDSDNDYHRRFQSVLNDFDLDELELGMVQRNVIVKSLVGEDMLIVAEDRGSAKPTGWADELAETLEPLENLRLIIIDPMTRFHGAGENDNHSATMFINQINRICRATGAAVLLVHHSAKSDVGGARGASAFVDGARTHISMATMAQKKAAAGGKDNSISQGDENKVVVELRKSNHLPYWTRDVLLGRMDGGTLETIAVADEDAGELRRAEFRDRVSAVVNFVRCNGRQSEAQIFAERKNIRFEGKVPTRDQIAEICEKMEAQGQLVRLDDGTFDVPRSNGGDVF
ncbi:MAG: AAA family ATPase [Shewanella sp.]